MAQRSYTPPKGRATPTRAGSRAAETRRSARSVTIQWLAIALVGLLALGAVFALGGGSGADPGGRAPIGVHGR